MIVVPFFFRYTGRRKIYMRYKKRSVFIDKDQEKTKKKYKYKYITEKYTEYRRKTRQRDGCVPGYGILNIPDK